MPGRSKRWEKMSSVRFGGRGINRVRPVMLPRNLGNELDAPSITLGLRGMYQHRTEIMSEWKNILKI